MMFCCTYWPVYLRFYMYYLEPLLAIVPKLLINSSLDIPIPLSSITTWFFSGEDSILIINPSVLRSLKRCFSIASDAFDKSSLMKTSLSVYNDLATISNNFLVSALNYIFWAPDWLEVEKKNDKGCLLAMWGRQRLVLVTDFNTGTKTESFLDNMFLCFINIYI